MQAWKTPYHQYHQGIRASPRTEKVLERGREKVLKVMLCCELEDPTEEGEGPAAAVPVSPPLVRVRGHAGGAPEAGATVPIP